MAFNFGLQKTRDSLKEAFENLFKKYDREFENDDEIDIIKLKVVKKGDTLDKSNDDIQKPKPFGYLYKKKDAASSDNEDYDDEESFDDEIDGSDNDDDPDPADLEKIINSFVHGSSTAIEVNSSNQQEERQRHRNPEKIRKGFKGSISHAFDTRLLGIIEAELCKRNGTYHCSKHFDKFNYKCFDCSLINISKI